MRDRFKPRIVWVLIVAFPAFAFYSALFDSAEVEVWVGQTAFATTFSFALLQSQLQLPASWLASLGAGVSTFLAIICNGQEASGADWALASVLGIAVTVLLVIDDSRNRNIFPI